MGHLRRRVGRAPGRSVGAAALSAALVCLTLLAGSRVDAQARHPVSGRVIAPVMGYEGAAWLERPEREREEQPTKAIAALDVRPGMVVADAPVPQFRLVPLSGTTTTAADIGSIVRQGGYAWQDGGLAVFAARWALRRRRRSLAALTPRRRART